MVMSLRVSWGKILRFPTKRFDKVLYDHMNVEKYDEDEVEV